jgi:uncharacterized protein YbdZ (MbtH family)
VNPTLGMVVFFAHMLHPFEKLRSFQQWDKVIDIDAGYDTSYTTQFQEACRKYVENEICAKQ